MRLLGFQNPYSQETTRLLGLDPAEMRQQALWSGLANAGFTLMGSNNLGDVGMAFSQGANDARQQYMNDAMLGYRMQQDAAEEERRQQEEADRAAALEMFPPEMQPIVRAYPQIGQQYLQQQYFPEAQPISNPTTYAPVQYRDKDGTVKLGIPVGDGTFRPVQMPQGAEVLDPYQSAYQKSAGGTRGKVETEQSLSANSDLSAADQALNIIQQIKDSPYIDVGTGFSSYGNVVRGTGGYDFQNIVDQAKAGAFLTVIEQLRGMGALSNMEGQSATAAVTRMNTATSKEAFLDAVNDYEKIILAAKQRAIMRGAVPLVDPPMGGVGNVPPVNSAPDLSNLSDAELEAIINGQ